MPSPPQRTASAGIVLAAPPYCSTCPFAHSGPGASRHAELRAWKAQRSSVVRTLPERRPLLLSQVKSRCQHEAHAGCGFKTDGARCSAPSLHRSCASPVTLAHRDPGGTDARGLRRSRPPAGPRPTTRRIGPLHAAMVEEEMLEGSRSAARLCKNAKSRTSIARIETAIAEGDELVRPCQRDASRPHHLSVSNYAFRCRSVAGF